MEEVCRRKKDMEGGGQDYSRVDKGEFGTGLMGAALWGYRSRLCRSYSLRLVCDISHTIQLTQRRLTIIYMLPW